jgi:RNA polymerase sigma-70 factor (ECF subfamily)
MRREKHPEYDPADPALVPDAPEAADHRVEAAEVSLRLRRAIDRLPVEQADLLRLAYFEDKAHVTIATERGVPLGTVKSRLRLALGRLRKEMGDT